MMTLTIMIAVIAAMIAVAAAMITIAVRDRKLRTRSSVTNVAGRALVATMGKPTARAFPILSKPTRFRCHSIEKASESETSKGKSTLGLRPEVEFDSLNHVRQRCLDVE